MTRNKLAIHEKPMKRLAMLLGPTLSLIALLRWAEKRAQRSVQCLDPLLALRGSGRHIWADQHADDFVRSLREGSE